MRSMSCSFSKTILMMSAPACLAFRTTSIALRFAASSAQCFRENAGSFRYATLVRSFFLTVPASSDCEARSSHFGYSLPAREARWPGCAARLSPRLVAGCAALPSGRLPQVCFLAGCAALHGGAGSLQGGGGAASYWHKYSRRGGSCFTTRACLFQGGDKGSDPGRFCVIMSSSLFA